jgi:hypothetical protein
MINNTIIEILTVTCIYQEETNNNPEKKSTHFKFTYGIYIPIRGNRSFN